MKKLIAREYLRVSKDSNQTGKSPDQQHDDNAKAFDRQGWTLHPDPPYRDTDRSASRFARTVREDFKRLIADLENDTFGADVLAIWESSRGSRRVGEWVDLVDLCKQRSVRIWVTTHGRLYDPANSRDRRSLLEDAVDAEYESDKSSERIRRDVRAAAENGKPHGKNLYGYLRVYDQKTGVLERVEAHPVQAPVVQEAAKLIISGHSFYAVAKSFNERGFEPRRPKRKEYRKDHGWTPPAVKQMLTMPAYAGKRQHRGEIISDAIWPALIEFEEWKRLQMIMSPPDRKRTNDWPATHLLSGIAACGICGTPLRIGKQNAGRRKDDNGVALPKPVDVLGKEQPYPFYYTYICPGVPGKLGPSGKTGFHVAMRETHLDQVATELALTRLEKPEFLVEVGQRGEGNNAERRILLEKIAGYQGYLDRLREEAAEKLRFDILLDQEERIGPKIRAAQERLEKLSELDPLVLRLLSEGAIRTTWEKMELAEKRRAIRAIMTLRVNRISPDRRGQRGINHERVDVVWR
ncbi:recombinase family protein [Arthrobacter sp. zg-Y1110]|uniref:recombinase family protein n=1 Tax=Arthrobacter sp. zg-Y1110 TaxID=2886932 RepID=UPI001D142C0A|nr:recombinase family protein [Arthrobacter sp. zg-Y1110]MCC3291252.1 recombinase family protein [Arthrobacter sp. zg-Y1110]UWX83678.1 recombinase family protein [Arthrobacter sp. zg-Y1110]